MHVGQRIGSYVVTRLIGKGAMGTVYEGMDETISRRVAIKHLEAAHAADRERYVRFLTEARVVNQIAHGGLVSTYQFGQFPDGGAFIVMEYLDGQTLAGRLENRASFPMTSDEICQLVRQVADTLSVVHRHGVVHRDIKPANLMLIPDSAVPGGIRVKVLDFGIAKVLMQSSAPSGVETRSGIAMGTPRYMAPEQIFGASTVDSAADIYALGIVFFECLVGHPPFDDEDEQKTLMAHVTKPIPDLGTLVPHVAQVVLELVTQMLAKEPNARPSALDVVARLDALGRSTFGELTAAKVSPPTSRRRRWSGVAATVLLLGGTAVMLASLQSRRAAHRSVPAVMQPPAVAKERPPAAEQDKSTYEDPKLKLPPPPDKVGKSEPMEVKAESQPIGVHREAIKRPPTDRGHVGTKVVGATKAPAIKARETDKEKSGEQPTHSGSEMKDDEIKTLDF